MNNGLTEQFNNPQIGQPSFQNAGGALAQASASREMEEVKGQIFMAKQFPRNVFQAEQRVLDTCKRPALAQTAMYSYPKGGTKVTGPSIRLAEAIAQNWGNLSYGIQELEQRNGESVAKAFCWDLETNVRQEKVFTVKHAIGTKKGLKQLTDPRDIYEKVANDGARRLRSCILGVIPGDIVDKAVVQCTETLAGNSKGPLKDRIASMLKGFKDHYRVTQEMVETKFGYNADSFSEYDYVELLNIANSLKDGMSKVEDWFLKDDAKNQSSGLGEAFKEEQKLEVKQDASNDIPIKQPELSL
ncbi:hypothetical protein [Lysinibacillus sphaericus]|uniref:hypothetical protein n=1 Tax=Lysinibacillus sphaericus TaxID=1421 RepID=UPI001910093A|nr:hypothetical protein [Lysinibacillus sphaericus]QPA56276.1 hypothetical protein INQ53_09940 [Lysinibacillus sphaericus]